jgi:hypothetical protein
MKTKLLLLLFFGREGCRADNRVLTRLNHSTRLKICHTGKYFVSGITTTPRTRRPPDDRHAAEANPPGCQQGTARGVRRTEAAATIVANRRRKLPRANCRREPEQSRSQPVRVSSDGGRHPARDAEGARGRRRAAADRGVGAALEEAHRRAGDAPLRRVLQRRGRSRGGGEAGRGALFVFWQSFGKVLASFGKVAFCFALWKLHSLSKKHLPCWHHIIALSLI